MRKAAAGPHIKKCIFDEAADMKRKETSQMEQDKCREAVTTIHGILLTSPDGLLMGPPEGEGDITFTSPSLTGVSEGIQLHHFF